MLTSSSQVSQLTHKNELGVIYVPPSAENGSMLLLGFCLSVLFIHEGYGHLMPYTRPLYGRQG